MLNEEKSSTDFEQWLSKIFPKENERKECMKKHFNMNQ